MSYLLDLVPDTRVAVKNIQDCNALVKILTDNNYVTMVSRE